MEEAIHPSEKEARKLQGNGCEEYLASLSASKYAERTRWNK